MIISVRCPATLPNDCNETWQDLERALAVLTTRADEALKAKADAEGSLATLHHRHADMEVPLRLAPSPAVPKRGRAAFASINLRDHPCLECRVQARYKDMQTKTSAATNEVMRLTVERNRLQNQLSLLKVGPIDC